MTEKVAVHSRNIQIQQLHQFKSGVKADLSVSYIYYLFNMLRDKVGFCRSYGHIYIVIYTCMLKHFIIRQYIDVAYPYIVKKNMWYPGRCHKYR